MSRAALTLNRSNIFKIQRTYLCLLFASISKARKDDLSGSAQVSERLIFTAQRSVLNPSPTNVTSLWIIRNNKFANKLPGRNKRMTLQSTLWV